MFYVCIRYWHYLMKVGRKKKKEEERRRKKKKDDDRKVLLKLLPTRAKNMQGMFHTQS